MQIWVDADAVPGDVKEIIMKAAQRLKVIAIFVANRPTRLDPSLYLKSITVPNGFDVADAYIVEEASSGDLAISADVPLAALLVAKGIVVLDPRGQLLTDANIQERLASRNFLQEMRESGARLGGPSSYNPQNKQRFAAAFDATLTKLARAAK